MFAAIIDLDIIAWGVSAIPEACPITVLDVLMNLAGLVPRRSVWPTCTELFICCLIVELPLVVITLCDIGEAPIDTGGC
jgi:hypothetical protein